MCRLPYLAGWLTALVLVTPIRAEPPPDPLRLVPQQTELFFKIEQPRKLFEAILHHPLLKQLLAIDAVREAYESTNARRFYQLIAYYEDRLGADRLELLDRLAGGGAVLGVKFGPDPAPSLLVVQARDEQLLRRFVKLGLEVLEQELLRQESKAVIQRDHYRNVEIARVGKDFFAAVAGSALLISNVEKPLQKAIDLHQDGSAKSLAAVGGVAEARKLVGPEALAWMWLNLDTVRKFPQAKEVFAQPRNDAQLTVLFGGLLDVARRSSFVCAGFDARQSEFVLSFRMPSGREGMPAEWATHLPPAGQPASRPLLEPKGVLYSTSYFLDVSKFWENRAKLFNDKQRQGLEDLDKKSGTFLAGAQLSKILAQLGPYQRIVVAHQPKPGYKVTPNQMIPAFGLVVEIREPEPFRKRMDAVLRAAALLATTQVKLKLVEEKHGEHKIVGYRFPEDASFKPDTTNFRFNFSPCFVAVDNQFLACSTLELCHELVDLLDRETKDRSAKNSGQMSQRTQIYARGGSELLEAFKDRLFTQVMLDQAVAPERATEQVQTFIDWVRRLGVLRIESNYGARDFRYDFRLEFAKEEDKPRKNEK